jgi:hypothetical protein
VLVGEEEEAGVAGEHPCWWGEEEEAAKKRREEEETAAAVAAVELFKQQEELEARAWAEEDGEVATGEGDADYELAILAICEDAASSGELATT